MKQSNIKQITMRFARSHLLQYVLYKEKATFQDIQHFFAGEEKLKLYGTKEILSTLLRAMEKEGFLYCKNGFWMVSPL